MATTPHPLVRIAIEPRRASDRAALLEALQGLADGAVSATDGATGQVFIEGATEEQLEKAIEALAARAALDLSFGTPQVVCLQTMARRAEVDWTHKTQGAGGFEYARLKIVFAPGIASAWINSLPEGGIPPDLLAGAERGIALACRAGAGSPVVDIVATLVDGAWHETNSTPLVFEKAASAAVRHALREVGVLLEPIMHVEIVVPARYAGAVRADLAARGGTVSCAAFRDEETAAIVGVAALADLLGYKRHLQRLAAGAARIAMTFSHYAPVEPPDPPRFKLAVALRAVRASSAPV